MGSVSSESGWYCPVFKRYVDYYLINTKKPYCIKRANGCGNCNKAYQKTRRRHYHYGNKGRRIPKSNKRGD